MACEKCGDNPKSVVMHGTQIWCWPCHNEVKFAHVLGKAAAVIQDSIEGGIEIKHGVCNPDGTPRRYYSKAEIREAAYQAGYFQGEDTPRSNPKIQERLAEQRAARKRS